MQDWFAIVVPWHEKCYSTQSKDKPSELENFNQMQLLEAGKF
jgi:hypothetical protein